MPIRAFSLNGKATKAFAMNTLILSPFDCRNLAQTSEPNPKTTRNLGKTGRGGGYPDPEDLLFLRHRIAFAGGEEEVHLESMLPGVEVVVAAAEFVERLMR